MKDLHMRELTIATSLCVMILWIGLYPSPFLRIMNGSIQALVDRLDRTAVASVELYPPTQQAK
jgi:NADH-quinone oxidoreductase subunit M